MQPSGTPCRYLGAGGAGSSRQGKVVDDRVSPESQRRAAEVVAESSLALDCLPRAIVVVDRDGTIVEWNKVLARFYGWARTEAVGRSLFDLITPPTLREAGRRPDPREDEAARTELDAPAPQRVPS